MRLSSLEMELRKMKVTLASDEIVSKKREQKIVKRVSSLVENIGGRFSSMMQGLGFAGSVSLHRGEGGNLDFKVGRRR